VYVAWFLWLSLCRVLYQVSLVKIFFLLSTIANHYMHIELPAELLDYFLRSNKSNINQSTIVPFRIWAHVVLLIVRADVHWAICPKNTAVCACACVCAIIYAHVDTRTYRMCIYMNSKSSELSPLPCLPSLCALSLRHMRSAHHFKRKNHREIHPSQESR